MPDIQIYKEKKTITYSAIFRDRQEANTRPVSVKVTEDIVTIDETLNLTVDMFNSIFRYVNLLPTQGE